MKWLNAIGSNFSMQNETSFKDVDLFHDEALEASDVGRHLRVLACKVGCEEGFLVLADTSHDIGVDDALQAHGEGVDVALRTSRVLGYQSAQLAFHALHGLAGVLHRSEQFGAFLGDLEPAQNPREFGLDRETGAFYPEGRGTGKVAPVQRSVECESSHVVDQVEGGDVLWNFGAACHCQAPFLWDWLHVANLDDWGKSELLDIKITSKGFFDVPIFTSFPDILSTN